MTPDQVEMEVLDLRATLLTCEELDDAITVETLHVDYGHVTCLDWLASLVAERAWRTTL